jgi:chromosome segregation ATPase
MKTSTMKFIALNCALAATLMWVAGCASRSYDKGAATSTALSATAEAVGQTSTSVIDVLGSLNNLTFKSQGDLRKQYDEFVSATKTLDASMKTLDERVASLHAKATDYLNNWTNATAAIQSEELRSLSAERKDAVAKELAGVEASYDGVKRSLAPFASDLKDIQTYLGTDLTASGLDTIKNIVSKTKVDAVPLRDSIKKLQGSFSSLGAALSPMMPGAETK